LDGRAVKKATMLVCLAGVTATGKTTIGKRLAKHLGVEFKSVDDVYSIIARKIGHKRQEELVMPQTQARIKDFNKLRVGGYEELFGGGGDRLVVEGFPLFFHEDRKLLKQVTGDNDIVFFYYKPLFELWVERSKKKYGKIPSWHDWVTLNEMFQPPDEYYQIDDEDVLFVHYEKYQRKGFTDKKWGVLQLPDLEDKEVLDLGCNAGWFGEYCYKAGARCVVGVDNNWRYLEEAKKRGVEPILQDLNNLKVGGRFDTVLCLATLHYIADKEKFIERVADLTKEMFVLEVPIFDDKGLKMGKKNNYFIPTKELVLHWLNKHFRRVVVVGESPAPDDSHRLVFKAWK